MELYADSMFTDVKPPTHLCCPDAADLETQAEVISVGSIHVAEVEKWADRVAQARHHPTQAITHLRDLADAPMPAERVACNPDQASSFSPVPPDDAHTSPQQATLEIHVNTPAGHLCSLSIGMTSSLSALKAAIEYDTGIPRCAQRLVYGLEELTAESCLHEFKEREVIQILLLQRPWGAGSLLQRLLNGDPSPAQVMESLETSCDDIKGNREIAFAAVAIAPQALQYMSVELKADHEVVLAAVLKSGLALQFASDDLRLDRRISLTAVVSDIAATPWVPPDLRADCLRVREAVDEHGVAEALREVPAFQTDRDVVLAIVAKDGSAVQYVSADLKEDGEVASAAVRQCAATLQCLPAKHRNNRDVMLAAVRQNWSALLCASRELKADRELVLQAAKLDLRALEIASPCLQNDELFVAAVHASRGRQQQPRCTAADRPV